MFRKLFLIIVFSLFIITLLPNQVLGQTQESQIGIAVNGQLIEMGDRVPVIIEGRTFVPIRGVFEYMDFDVYWMPEFNGVMLRSSQQGVILIVGVYEFMSNGMVISLDVAPRVINGSAMLPIRPVLESVGYDLEWDVRNNVINITSKYNHNIIQHDEFFLDELDQLIFRYMNRVHGNLEWLAQENITHSSIVLPNRRLTQDELTVWIHDYSFLGGVSYPELEVFILTNRERENYGLSPLIMCLASMIAARFKAQSMSNLGYFSHTNPAYGDMISMHGELFGVRPMGENIAVGQRTSQQVVIDWVNSPMHRANILHHHSYIGVGHYNGRWVQLFR